MARGLGLNRRGSFAAVTNFRTASAQRVEAYSRGELVCRFLERPDDAAFDRYLNAHHMQYNPFNIVFGDTLKIRAWDHDMRSSRVLGSGFHSVSNGSIDQPWPKMARGVDRLRQYLEQGNQVNDENIIEMMQDRTRAEAHQLPETGLDISREQSLSSIFVEGERYGTRTTTVMKFSAYGIEISELNYLPGGETGEMQRYTVQLPH